MIAAISALLARLGTGGKVALIIGLVVLVILFFVILRQALRSQRR